MAILQTKTSSKTLSTGTTSTSALLTTTTGSLVVVVAVNDKGATGGITNVACAGMSFTKLSDLLEGSPNLVANVTFWYALNITGQTTPTLTVTYGAGEIGGAIIREYSGGFTVLDKSAATNDGNHASATPNSGATPTLTGSNDVVIGWAGTGDSGNTYTAGAGYANATTLKIGTTVDMGMEDKTLSGSTAAQTATFTITNSDNWVCGVATFKTAVSGFLPNPVVILQAINRANTY